MLRTISYFIGDKETPDRDTLVEAEELLMKEEHIVGTVSYTHLTLPTKRIV